MENWLQKSPSSIFQASLAHPIYVTNEDIRGTISNNRMHTTKGLFGKSYLFEIDPHEIDLFQMALFGIDILETVLFGNIQRLIEIDYFKSTVESF